MQHRIHSELLGGHLIAYRAGPCCLGMLQSYSLHERVGQRQPTFRKQTGAREVRTEVRNNQVVQHSTAGHSLVPQVA